MSRSTNGCDTGGYGIDFISSISKTLKFAFHCALSVTVHNLSHARLLEGALGHSASAQQDSFSQGLLDHPHYTRPESIDGLKVPQVLLSGDHAAIESYRLKESLEVRPVTWLKGSESQSPTNS